MITEGVVTVRLASIDHVLDQHSNCGCIALNREHLVVLNCGLLVLGQVRSVEIRDLVQVSYFVKCVEEVVSTHSSLTLEEGEPEDLGVLSLKASAYLGGQVVVDNIFEVNFVEVVGPWMKHREALVLDALSTVLENVITDVGEVGLVG